jgi:8-oxo-dGTP diphosphatase
MRSVSDIDWARWIPKDRATLLFVHKGPSVLLIKKKRGLGAGKINAPGGRIEAGETPLEAAIREVEEEVCITARDIDARGRLCFQFVDGYSIEAFVFVAYDYVGQPEETPEAVPFWVRADALPYREMWADDELWVPRVLRGESVLGRFVFDGDTMLDYAVDVSIQ